MPSWLTHLLAFAAGFLLCILATPADFGPWWLTHVLAFAAGLASELLGAFAHDWLRSRLAGRELYSSYSVTKDSIKFEGQIPLDSETPQPTDDEVARALVAASIRNLSEIAGQPLQDFVSPTGDPSKPTPPGVS